MNLVILTQYYPPEVGAPQARLSGLAEAFVRRGHHVTVLTAMPNYPTGKVYEGYGGFYSREQWEGVDIIRTFIYPTQSASLIPRLTSYFSFVASSSLVGTILLKSPDYLLVESPPLFLGLAGIWLKWLKRARLIFNVSDLWPQSAVDIGVLGKDSLAHKISSELEACCYRNAFIVTGQSRSILADVCKRFPACKTFHLSNGVDTNLFKPDSRTAAARAALSGNGTCVALYAGLHGLAQGLEQVLKTAKSMESESGVKFVLLGEGPEKRKLMHLAQERAIDNLDFMEIRPAKDVPALLASADIALVTLKVHITGAVPSKLYEALASGRPVILVAEGEAAEIVQRHHAGITVRPGDVGTLVMAIRALVADPTLRRQMGENGRRAAEQFFDRTQIGNRFIEHLEVNLSQGVRGH